MNILIPVAAYHEYNTAVYVLSALQQLGHDARVITQGEFYEDPPGVDLFFGVDSAGPLDFPEKHLSKTAMWFIDSRHNNDPARRTPDDDTNAKRLSKGGGWVFQAQKPDWQRNVEQGAFRSCWLPLAADPSVWKPFDFPKEFDVGFCGNVWDATRQAMLEAISEQLSLFHIVQAPRQAAVELARCKVGFNISSFFGTPVAYDINMRVFEVMSCGLPLVTNWIPEMDELGMIDGYHLLAYRTLEELPPALQRVLLAELFGTVGRMQMGQQARQLILDGHTYKHRMVEALEVLEEAGMFDD